MLASTVQFSSNDQPPITRQSEDHRALGPAPKTRPYGRALRTQQRARPDPSMTVFHAEAVLAVTNKPCRIVNVPPMSEPAPDSRRCPGPLTAVAVEVLLRKEVIQPHLPVRLP